MVRLCLQATSRLDMVVYFLPMVAEKGHPRPLRKYSLPRARGIHNTASGTPQRYPPHTARGWRAHAHDIDRSGDPLPSHLYYVSRSNGEYTALLAEPILISFIFAGVDELLTEYFYSGRSYQRIVHRL